MTPPGLGRLSKMYNLFKNVSLHISLYFLKIIPDRYKTQQICEKAVEDDSSNLRYVPNDPKFLETCKKAVEKDP